ncbi:MAG TPA: hypothetical protein VFX41_04580 [Actinomycetales bacterium]|nr:hypothetical protein [Actinomycetales bacterium]
MVWPYAFVALDLLVLVLACLPMRWARKRPALRWFHRLFVLLHAAVLVVVLVIAVAAQRADHYGALFVLVYLGPAFVFSAIRLVYERTAMQALRTA